MDTEDERFYVAPDGVSFSVFDADRGQVAIGPFATAEKAGQVADRMNTRNAIREATGV